MQWNLSNQDTIRADLNVLNREVFSIQRLLSTQMWHLGQVKVSCLWKYPLFRVVLIERGSTIDVYVCL